MMPKESFYDVIVIGGGPAGLQCARELSASGRKVLLAERNHNFYENNFSSAGTVPEIMRDFELPERVIGSSWNKITLVTSRTSHAWSSSENKGYVLEFSELKQFLAEEIKKNSGEVLMSHRFMDAAVLPEEIAVELENTENSQKIVVRTKFLVDSTGPLRSVMKKVKTLPGPFQGGVGIEYLVEVQEKDYRPKELIFLVGDAWLPGGYSWVFPMAPHLLKIGAGFFYKERLSNKPLKDYVDLVLRDYLKLSDYKILDTHGGRLLYHPEQADIYYHGRLIAAGDTVSAVNPLGGEGIRHAMWSGRFAAQEILKVFFHEDPNLSGYESRMRAYYGNRWRQSNQVASYFYEKFNDKHIEFAMKFANHLNMEQVMDVLFYYNFNKGIFSKVLSAFQWVQGKK